MKKDNAFPNLMQKNMGGFQIEKPGIVWDMKRFIAKDEWSYLKEQELFYRATDYRGS